MNEDKSTRYQRLKRRASVVSTALSAAFLVALVATPASAILRDTAVVVAYLPDLPPLGSYLLVVVLYVTLLFVVAEVLGLPVAYYQGFTLEHQYGLSTERRGHWLREHVKGALVGYAFGLAAAMFLYYAVRRWPEWWWLIVATGFSVFTIVLANLGPLLLMPLFYRFSPLDRQPLRARLVALAERAGAPVLDAYEWKVSDRTKKANAALAGLGNTRRILVSDTLLADYSDEEIEVILAHEIGHYVYADIWRGVALETGLAFAGFYLAHRVLDALGPLVGLRGATDVAGLPLLVLAGAGLSLLLLPVANGLSRRHERRADAFALRLTGNAEAFISAMRRLGAQNLAEDTPSRFVEIVFHSHPPIPKRIEAAKRYRTK